MKKYKLIGAENREATLTSAFGISKERYKELRDGMAKALEAFADRKGNNIAEFLNDLIGLANNPAELAFCTWVATSAWKEHKSLLNVLQAVTGMNKKDKKG